jgi:hypothetical protein
MDSTLGIGGNCRFFFNPILHTARLDKYALAVILQNIFHEKSRFCVGQHNPFTHLKENFSMVKIPYLCKKSKGKPV